MEAMERKIRVLKEAEVRRQRKRLLDQEEMDRKRQELQKAQSLQVRIYISRTLCADMLNIGSLLLC
jgi:hypothetical protein